MGPSRATFALASSIKFLPAAESDIFLAKLAETRPHFSAAVVEISGGRFTPVQGGVLIRDNHGNIVGAVGVSGDTSENDEACAVAGIEAAGLKADTGA